MLRLLALSDAEALQAINELALGYQFPLDLTQQQLKKLLGDDHHILLGFEDPSSGRLLGYVHAEVFDTLYSETALNILGLAVLPDYQNQGIGKRLMQALEAQAKSRSYAFIRLHSSAQRQSAHAFYRKIGYNGDKLQKRFIKTVE
ncbi:GNAT family N-acetyltransferase [Streptococcus sobrinus]|uniref:GNAT family N-acetyltransferase n=1 Tax=Streptococcus sobrinus TaxID=1310 RepID=UPI0002FF83D6|nr:GNAT family N-acetyltransferase [Streptococcus sobrinus]